MKTVRTRFAPSPTGYLHVGGIRTALFAWLVARQNNGKFILRLEDTDKKREIEGSGEHIIESLKWLGIDWDEGPDIGGLYGPYRQSERLDTYKMWAQKLIDSGRAYADPYTPEEVQAFREEAIKNKKPFKYRDHRPIEFQKWDGTTPLRFVSTNNPDRLRKVNDVIMGGWMWSPDFGDDFILIKADGYPTYNFAHIIDDIEMKITHVIRGQEFIPSYSNYIDLYDALGITYEDLPVFATVPHVLGKEGNKKLSKRDGAKDVLDYRNEGYLPEAVDNFLATLGWNDGTEKEVFSIRELTEKFDLSRVQRSGARFDEQRLVWLNGAHVRQLSLDHLYNRTLNKNAEQDSFWPEEANSFDDDYKKQVLGLVQERLKYFAELPELTRFFFTDLPVNPELISTHKQLKKLDKTELKALLKQTVESLDESDFSVEDLTERLNKLLEKTGQKPAVLFSLIRIATTQAPASPGLAETLALLGKEKSLERINAQIQAV